MNVLPIFVMSLALLACHGQAAARSRNAVDQTAETTNPPNLVWPVDLDRSFRAVSLPSDLEPRPLLAWGRRQSSRSIPAFVGARQAPQNGKDGVRDGLLKGVLIGAGAGLGFSAIVYGKGDGEWGSYRAFAAGSVLWGTGIGALIGVVSDAVHRPSSAPSLKPIIPTGHEYCAAGRLR